MDFRFGGEQNPQNLAAALIKGEMKSVNLSRLNTGLDKLIEQTSLADPNELYEKVEQIYLNTRALLMSEWGEAMGRTQHLLNRQQDTYEAKQELKSHLATS